MTNMFPLEWPAVLAAAVAAQWILVALVSIVAPAKMRTAFAVSTAVFAAGWLVAFDVRSLLQSKATVTEAAVVAARPHQGSCASIRKGMSGDEVTKKLGAPDEVRNDEAVRGPGSSSLIYRDLRCAVHLFDEKVELVD